MNTYLTNDEIAELKAIKTRYINESDLSDLKTFLKKNGKEISIVNRYNKENTFKIILDSFPDSVVNHPAHKQYKEEHPLHGFSPEKNYVVESYLFELNPKLDKLYDMAYTLNFDEAVRAISQKTEQIQGFDSTSFLLDADYDFKPFSIDIIDKKLIDNTVAIDKAVSKWFDSFTKELNEEQKQIVSKNLLPTINFFVQNSDKNTVKDKGTDFKSLVTYISNQSNE